MVVEVLEPIIQFSLNQLSAYIKRVRIINHTGEALTVNYWATREGWLGEEKSEILEINIFKEEPQSLQGSAKNE